MTYTMKGSFNAVKRSILTALHQGRVFHEARPADKNWLASGELALPEAIALVGRTRGHQAECGPHHLDPSIEVWILRPEVAGVSWYVKCYEAEKDVWFISFHPTEVRSQ
jgi:hypothetical protein